MSEDKKPKKDLRARLGRTIAPNTPGAPPIAAPGGVIAPPAAAPVAAAPKAASSPGEIAAPPVAAPVMAPPIAAPSVRSPFGNDIAPPPFARPAPVAEAPRAPERKRSVDPFAVGQAAPNEVRVVFDEKPTDDRAAKAASARNRIIIAVGVVLGLVIGTAIGSVNNSRGLYNITVRDGHDVHDSFEAAATVVTQAQTHLDAIAASANGGADHHPMVNYDEIAALTALENPLHAGAFSRKNYARFDPATVDELFNYEHDVQELWADFGTLNAITTGQARRATLDSTAAATSCPGDLGHDEASAGAALQTAISSTTDAANAQYIALISTTDDGTVGGTLGFGEQNFDQTTHAPIAGTFMRAGRTGPGRGFETWTPGTPITGTGTRVIAIDGPSSAAILGDRHGAFRTYAQTLEQARAHMRTTMELQQRLHTALEQIENIQEQFAL